MRLHIANTAQIFVCVGSLALASLFVSSAADAANAVPAPAELQPATSAPTQHYAAQARKSSLQLSSVVNCLAGTWSPTGQTPCDNASPGYFVDIVGAMSQTACLAGYYQPQEESTSCLPADAGHYVSELASPVQTACEPGTYQPDLASINCLMADTGHFVAGAAAQAQTACALGSYQPNTGTTNCLLAQPGYFVASPGQAFQGQCLLGTTSGPSAISCAAMPVLNIDNSDTTSTYQAATDGVMVMRYLLGLRDDAVTIGAHGNSPLRTDPQILAHLTTFNGVFDVDGDGKSLATTDGVMIVRRMLGLAGAALTAGARNSARSDADVALAIDALMPMTP